MDYYEKLEIIFKIEFEKLILKALWLEKLKVSYFSGISERLQKTPNLIRLYGMDFVYVAY